MPDASLFRVATPSEKLFSGSYLKSRLQFSVRDYYTIIALADWKHMVTGLTLSLLFQSSPRMCGHSLRYKLTSLVHAKCHPNLTVTKQTGARELGIWSPYFTQRWEVFFPFVGISITYQEKIIGMVQCLLMLTSQVKLYPSTQLELETLYFGYTHSNSYILYLIPAVLTNISCLLSWGLGKMIKIWFSLSQYSCCWWQGFNTCRNRQPNYCEWTLCIPAHACSFSWN